MTTIYLARHATPDWNRKDIPYHLPPGPPLIEQGRAEAAQLGQFLQQQHVQQIYTSPLERCLDTARLAADGTGLPYQIMPGLIEIQPGESELEILQRLQPAFEQAGQHAAEQGPVCLLTHGGPVSILLSWLGMDATVLEARRVFDYHNPLPPAGAWEASRIAPDSAWQLRLAFVPGNDVSLEDV